MSYFYDNWRAGGIGTGAYTLKSNATTSVPLTVQGISGQTANLLEIKNSAGTVVYSVSNGGDVVYIGDETISDALTVGGNLVGNGNLTIAGTTTLNGAVTLGNASSDTITSYGNAIFRSSVTVWNDLQVNNLLSVVGGVYLYERGADPSSISNQGNVYTKEVSSITELHYLDSSGNVTQVTSSGSLNGGEIFWGDDVNAAWGNTAASPDFTIDWETADADAHYVNLAVSSASRNIIISEDRNIDWGHAAQTNPTLWLHSADGTDTADYLNFAHNQTNAVIDWGNGALSLIGGDVYVNGDDVSLVLGAGQDASFLWETADADAHYLSVVTTGSNNIIINADANTDFTHAGQTNPTLWIQSADATTVADYISLAHDQTNAQLGVGAGDLILTIAGANLLPSADDAWAIGASGTGVSDLYLASGAVIDLAAGDVVLTHSSNTLTMTGGNLVLTQPVVDALTPTALTVTGGAHTAITAATEDIGANLNFSATKTWAAGAGPLATQREVWIQGPTYAGNAAGALTITDAYGFYVDDPVQGTNMTLTRTWAAGFGGNVGFGNGSEPLPAITFLSDPDTGIFSPGANNIRLSFGGTANVNFSSGVVGADTHQSYGNNAVTLKGYTANGATAVGLITETANTFSTAGAILVSFRNNTSEKAYVDKDGNYHLTAALGSRTITKKIKVGINGATGVDFNLPADADGAVAVALTSALPAKARLVDAMIICTEALTFSSGTVSATASLGDDAGTPFDEWITAADCDAVDEISSTLGSDLPATGLVVSASVRTPTFEIVNGGTGIFSNATAGKWNVFVTYIDYSW